MSVSSSSSKPWTLHDHFDRFVVGFGGRLVRDLIPSQTSDNADYLFESDGVIGEFKFIETERKEDPEIQAKIESKIKEWKDSGRLPGVHFGNVITSSHLPQRLQWELALIHSKPIRRRIQKANTQMKLTREYLSLPNAKGLVFLANEADHSMPPEHFTYAVHQSLIRDFSGIDHVSVLTVNLPTFLANIPTKLRLWIDYRRDNRDRIDPAFLARIRNAWAQYLTELLGEPVPSYMLNPAIPLSALRHH